MADKSFIYGLLGGAIAGYLTRPKQAQAVTQIMQPTQPQPQPPQIFDYIINLYTDKIEIIGYDREKTTLSTISELNEWLTNITEKNILIWNNGNITGDFEPTSNRYVITGKPIRFNTVLKNSNMDLYYFAHYLPEEEYSTSYISNFGEYSISNVNIFAIGTPIVIWSRYNVYSENIHITAIGSRHLHIEDMSGGVTAVVSHAIIIDSALIDGLMLTAGTAQIINTTVGKHLYLDIGYINAGPEIYLTDTVHMVYYYIDKIPIFFGFVNPNQTVTASVGIKRSTYQYIYVTGVYEITMYYYTMLKPLSKDEAEITVDAVNGTISVTNKTTRTINMVVTYSMALSRL